MPYNSELGRLQDLPEQATRTLESIEVADFEVKENEDENVTRRTVHKFSG